MDQNNRGAQWPCKLGLDAALAHLKHAAVDHILCAGDLVDFGDHGDGVVQRIRDAGIPCVQGNHDRAASEKKRYRQHIRRRDNTPIKLLTEPTLAYLDTLPRQLHFTWADKTVLLTHAAPWPGDKYIYPESTQALFKRVAIKAQTDVVILGHTHRPLWVDMDGCTIINLGSTSQNYLLGFGTYGVLSLPARDFSLFRVDTGKSVALDKMVL